MDKNIQPHPVYKGTYFSKYNEKNLFETNIISSLFLQKLLYFNIFFDIAVAFIFLFSNIYKVIIFKEITVIISLILFIIWIPMEIYKFNCGYFGNLKESVI